MIYTLANQFSEPIRSYQWNMVEAIANRFPSLTLTLRQNIPAHFTLKYHFETDNISEVEFLLTAFAKDYRGAAITVGQFEHFNYQTIFSRIELSESAQFLYDELIGLLRGISWMQWQQFDAPNLLFHMTVAEQCGELGQSILEFARSCEQTFQTTLDNITIYQQTSMAEDGLTFWDVHKRFDLTQ